MAAINFSLVRNVSDMSPQTIAADWGYLQTLLSNPKPRGNKPLAEYLTLSKTQKNRMKNGPGWVPGTFRKDGRPCDDDIESLSVFAGDIDNENGATPITRATLKTALNGHTYHAHTSYSHSPDCEKWRFVIPLKRPITKAEHAQVFEHFDRELGGALDPKGKTPSQLYYLPSHPPDAGGLFEYFSADGEWFDPNSLPAQSAPKPKAQSLLGGALPQRFTADLKTDRRLCARWEGNTRGLNDKTRSGFDASLAALLLRLGYFDDEVAKILRKFPHGKAAEQGEKYIARLLEKMRPAKNDAPKVETFSAVELQSMDIPEPRWVVPGILCEGFSYLVGKPKLGKSWLALALGISTANGGRALGQIEVPQGDALYLALEDSRRRLQDRLRMICRDEAWPARLTLAPSNGWPRMGDGGLDQLRRWLDEHPEARLVIIDTLARFRPPRSGADGLYEGDYAVTGALQALAIEHHIGLVVIHHTRKMTADDPFDTLSGTLGLSGAADTLLLLERERGRHDALLRITGRDVEEQELALKWEKESMQWTLLGDADKYRRGEQRQAIIDLLEKVGESMGPKQIAGALGREYMPTVMMLKRLAEAGDIDHVGRGQYQAVEF